MKALCSILICFLVSSCATMMNSKSVDIYVDSEADPVKFKLSTDTTTWHETPVLLSVERAKKDIELTVLQDSTEKTIVVKHHLSPAFSFGNVFIPILYIGYAVDLSNNNRFTYPTHITLRKSDKPKLGLIPASKQRKNDRGDLLMRFSYDIGQQNKNFNYSGEENLSSVLGMSFGIGYYPWKRLCLTLNGGGVYIPGGFLDRLSGGPVVYSKTGWLSLQLGTDLSIFHFDLGVQYNGSNLDKLVRYENSSGVKRWVTTHEESHHNFGLACSAYLKFFGNLHIGVDYLPTLFVVNNGHFNSRYSELILLKVGFTKSIPGKN